MQGSFVALPLGGELVQALDLVHLLELLVVQALHHIG